MFDGTPRCYLCHGDNDVDGALLKVPCRNCQRGSIRVHQACLEQSLSAAPFVLSISNNYDEMLATATTHCHVCHCPIEIRLHIERPSITQRLIRWSWRFHTFYIERVFFITTTQPRSCSSSLLHFTFNGIYFGDSCFCCCLRFFFCFLLVSLSTVPRLCAGPFSLCSRIIY